jgi:hypothetical protein
MLLHATISPLRNRKPLVDLARGLGLADPAQQGGAGGASGRQLPRLLPEALGRCHQSLFERDSLDDAPTPLHLHYPPHPSMRESKTLLEVKTFLGTASVR